MSSEISPNEFLVISRGQWDADKSPEEIQAAIDRFYAWHGEMVAQGVMRPGQRLARDGKRVSGDRIVDGPFAEAKEVVGGFWFIRASSLEEAARIAWPVDSSTRYGPSSMCGPARSR
jgi:hypothetical protein